MDKETIVKLAQPAARALLAISILSVPFLAKAASSIYVEGAYNVRPIFVRHDNSCAD